ncbi:MAG TPA: 5-oxoprolinase [Gammaproteobacteria bacterium]|nr:5-oxoprolinase [Gammaproteobacteria bacterium]
MGMRLGIDIGGTFTDFILVTDTGELIIRKVLSTPAAPEEAVFLGVADLAKKLELSLGDFVSSCDHIIHGTTIATNTLITRSGPKMGILHTEGFRDILYLRDGFKPERYNLQLEPPTPLIERYLRLGVSERVLHDGSVETPLDEGSVRDALAAFRNAGVTSIAVSLLWSMINPSHERRIAEIIEEEMPEAYIALSCDILPRIREYPRACATALSAYVGSAIEVYLTRVAEFFQTHGYRRDLLIMQVTGSSARVPDIQQRPVLAIGSGPAAGPPASLFIGEREKESDLMLVEMGGTSFEASMITSGELPKSTDANLHGFPIGVAAVDVHSIGAGGGSIAWIDNGGMLRVGPQSAGASPGPACYNLGGVEATVTDANLVLGYLDEDNFLDGRMLLSRKAAEQALDKLATQLDMTVVGVAAAIYQIINTEMVGAMRAVSVMRGVDPRRYTVIVGGGAGGAHAAKIAQELGIRKAICPTVAGGLCAFGMLAADVGHDYLTTRPMNTDNMNIDDVNEVFSDMETRALKELRTQGFSPEEIKLSRFADAKYPYQSHEIIVAIPPGELCVEDIQRMSDSFHTTHERLYTYCLREMAVDMNGWRLTATAKLPPMPIKPEPIGTESADSAKSGMRPVYFHEVGDFSNTPIFSGPLLRAGMSVRGPAIVELPTTTIVVFPEHTVDVGEHEDFHIQIPQDDL